MASDKHGCAHSIASKRISDYILETVSLAMYMACKDICPVLELSSVDNHSYQELTEEPFERFAIGRCWIGYESSSPAKIRFKAFISKYHSLQFEACEFDS